MNEWVPAIALTGHDSASEAHRALAAGFQVHVGKPADAWMLAHAVVNVVDMTPLPPVA
jgi:CheY-like chemotaxis protein